MKLVYMYKSIIWFAYACILLYYTLNLYLYIYIPATTQLRSVIRCDPLSEVCLRNLLYQLVSQ